MGAGRERGGAEGSAPWAGGVRGLRAGGGAGGARGDLSLHSQCSRAAGARRDLSLHPGAIECGARLAAPQGEGSCSGDERWALGASCVSSAVAAPSVASSLIQKRFLNLTKFP